MDKIKANLNNPSNDKIIVNFKDISNDKLTIKFKEILKINTSLKLGYDKKSGKLSLLNEENQILSEIDLPVEKIINNAYYDKTSKELVLKFENLDEIRVPLDFNGGTNEKEFNEFKEEVNKAINETKQELNSKVEKVDGKQLSTNDLTNELLEKLNSLNNYDDTNIQKQIDDIKLILTTDDVDFDSLQELVNALKNNVSSISDIFQILNRKEDKSNLVITTEVGTSQAIGGIPKGTILKGKTVRDVLDEMLFPYIAFSMNVQSVNPTGTYEKGTSVTIKSVTVRITSGTKPVTNIKLYESNKTTLLGEKTSGIVTDNTFSINKTVTSSVSFYATATDGTSNLSDSSSFLAFYDPTFYGLLDVGYTLTSDLITGKSKELKANKSNTRTYNATNQHPFLAYPSSYGALTSIKDGNGFECIGDFNSSTLNLTVKSGTVSYRVYVLKSATTGTGYKYTFS